ncbi:MAG: DUF1049 domain-containing protein [Proteobacteria bacterium]|nr:DUF1049 domain-containing protein [Pseudomonadota bacterium]
MLRFLAALPFILLLVLFAMSNTQPVRVGLWPTDYAFELPLAVAVLIGAALAFLAGALIVWLGTFPLRRRARRAEAQTRVLEARLQELQARIGSPIH